VGVRRGHATVIELRLVSQDARVQQPFEGDAHFPMEVQFTMAAPARSVAVPALSPRLLAVALLSVGLMLLLAYLVGFDQGAVSRSGMYLHELMHDGRHLLGVPCH
jgi:Probable cobalt transporter subunit (CbtB)